MRIGLQKLVLVLAFLASGGIVRADTTIQFENIGGGNGDQITSYGSNAAGTPKISVSYRTFDPSNPDNTTNTVAPYAVLDTSALLGLGNYGTLPVVARAYADTYALEIGFTVNNGFQGTIKSFNLAGFLVDTDNTFIQIVDRSGNPPLWSSSNLTASGSTYTPYTPDLTFTGSVYLQFGNTFSVGIDDIEFSQAPVIASAPEPSTLVLAATGLIVLGIMRRRRAR